MFRIAKIQASTLAEAIVALVIIAVISGLALMTFISISSSSNNQLKILALYELENIISISHTENSWFNEDYEKNNIKIEKIVNDFGKTNLLKEVTYKVSSKQGKILFVRKEIVNIKSEEIKNETEEFSFN